MSLSGEREREEKARFLDSITYQNLDLALMKSRAPWRIVIGHHTMKSIGHHGDTQEIVHQLLPILEVLLTRLITNL